LKQFCNRLHRKRYADKSWLPSVSEDYKLRKEDTNDFFNSLIEKKMKEK
jgi:hypothetical protein